MTEFIQNFGGFFSDYYLGELLEKKHKGNLGENTRIKVYGRLKKRWEVAFRLLGVGSREGETRQKWLLPLFEELGFGLKQGEAIDSENETLKSSHKEVDAEGKTLIYADLLAWGKDPDAFSSSEGRNNTPHKKMERLLVAANIPWGIIANGRILRLLKQEQGAAGRAHLQVDLENIFEQDDQLSFNIFWALFRKEAYVKDQDGKCLLDKIDDESRQHATKVSDQLKYSVFRALELLVQGLLDDPTNKGIIKPKDDLFEIFRQSLVYLYRLLFVLYAESMELLPISLAVYRDNYSIEDLRELIESPSEQFQPNEYRLWDSLKALFFLVYHGVKGGDFYITQYNGKLFSPENAPFLEKCKLNDWVMKDILFNLSTTDPQEHRGRDRISYRELGVEQLGAVYEGLLEYEPKIASEEMAVVKIGKEQQVMPKSLAHDVKIEETIPKGRFYLALWGGRRKGTGSYYTPKAITGFLVEQALNPLVEGRSSEEILNLKIIDPAMGSGAFLVAACHFLADAYGRAKIAEGLDEDDKLDEYERAQYRRLVAERCLYGVDLNPMAVELAKLSLWLTTLAEDKPLTFLDHHLKCGNSLIGAEIKDVLDFRAALWLRKKKKYISDQYALFDKEEFEQNINILIKHRNWLESEPSDTADKIHKKERLVEKDQKEGTFYSKLKLLCDLWCSCWFWPAGAIAVPDESIFKELRDYIFKEQSSLSKEICGKYLDPSIVISGDQRFFHWELEFPEVYLDEEGKFKKNPGFDAALGNPPWDIIKPNSQEFFCNFDPNFRSYPKQKAKKVISDLCEKEEIKREWDEYENNLKKQSEFFRTSNKYLHLGKGDINSFKLFLESFFHVLGDGAHVSIIVPSGFHTDEGCMPLREFLFNNTQIKFLYSFENRKKIFPIDSRFKFDLIGVIKGLRTESFKAGFMLHDLEMLGGIWQSALNLPIELIMKFSPDTLSIMEFKSQNELKIAQKIYNNNPLIGEIIKDIWDVILTSEIHMTNDSNLFNLEKKGFPLYEGKMIHQFTSKFDEPRYWIEEKRGKTKVGKNKNGSYDFQQHRLGIRSVARSTDERTIISTILPKDIFCGNSILVTRSNTNLDSSHLLFICSCLNSLTLDFIMRLKVSANLNIFFIYQLPIPRLQKGNWYFDNIIKRAARLICTAPEFRDLWKEIMGTEWSLQEGANEEHERTQLRAEIDALVGHLFGLNEDEVEYVLSTFPLIQKEIKEKKLEEFIKLEKSIPGNKMVLNE